MTAKDDIRSQFLNQLVHSDAYLQGAGKLAEKIRSLDSYMSAKCVFVPPTPFFQQIRLNSLIDRKIVVVPDKSLIKGFFVVNPRSISFKDFTRAASAHGLPKFGKLLRMEEIAGLNIELMFTGAIAVDQGGTRLGSGNGFFDLAYALLGELGGFQECPEVIAVIDEQQFVEESLPLDIWDVHLTGTLTLESVRYFEKPATAKGQIFWNELPMKRIRKISILWQLFHKEKRIIKTNPAD